MTVMSTHKRKKTSKETQPPPQDVPIENQPGEDRHRSPHLIRVSRKDYLALKNLSRKTDRPMTKELSRAIDMYLKALGERAGQAESGAGGESQTAPPTC